MVACFSNVLLIHLVLRGEIVRVLLDSPCLLCRASGVRCINVDLPAHAVSAEMFRFNQLPQLAHSDEDRAFVAAVVFDLPQQLQLASTLSRFWRSSASLHRLPALLASCSCAFWTRTQALASCRRAAVNRSMA